MSRTPAEVGNVRQHGQPFRIGCGHPVVGYDDEPDTVGVGQGLDAVDQPAQQPVGRLDA